MEWINDITYWHWLILAVALIILEILMPGAYFLWMGISAAAVGAAMFIFPGMPFLVQILIFAMLSVITVLIYKAHRKNNPVVTEISTYPFPTPITLDGISEASVTVEP